MKKIFTVAVLLISSMFFAQSNGVTGKWRTIDDETGEARAIVEIYEKSGKIYGRVMEIFAPEHKKDTCKNCSGLDANKPIVGLTIIKGLSKDGDEYNSGEIMDPKNGRHYKCSIVLKSKDKLKVRGYIGIALLGRTQYWYRVK
jgi:uncharacterized protein (DUF2147 family)